MRLFTNTTAAFLLSLGAVTAVHAADTPSLDILGLKIGTPAEEAKDKLLELNPNYTEVEEIKALNTGDLMGYYASYQVDNKLQGASQVLFADGVVASIGHATFLEPGKEIPLKTLREALFEKYGQRPTDDHQSSLTQMNWKHHRDGSLLTRGGDYKTCPNYYSVDLRTGFVPSPDTLHENCGSRIYVYAWVDEATKLVNRYSVSIHAESLLYDAAIKREEARKAEIEAQRKAAIEAAAKNKLKL